VNGEWARCSGATRLALTDEFYEFAPQGFRSKQILAIAGRTGDQPSPTGPLFGSANKSTRAILNKP
jgi:hypothetical protein